MLGHQGLVGGNDVLASLEGAFDSELGRAVRPADQFDEHVDIRVFSERGRVIEPAILVGIDRPVTALAARAYACNLHNTGQAKLVLAFDQFNQSTANMAETCDAYFQRPQDWPLKLLMSGLLPSGFDTLGEGLPVDQDAQNYLSDNS